MAGKSTVRWVTRPPASFRNAMRSSPSSARNTSGDTSTHRFGPPPRPVVSRRPSANSATVTSCTSAAIFVSVVYDIRIER